MVVWFFFFLFEWKPLKLPEPGLPLWSLYLVLLLGHHMSVCTFGMCDALKCLFSHRFVTCTQMSSAFGKMLAVCRDGRLNLFTALRSHNTHTSRLKTCNVFFHLDLIHRRFHYSLTWEYAEARASLCYFVKGQKMSSWAAGDSSV